MENPNFMKRSPETTLPPPVLRTWLVLESRAIHVLVLNADSNTLCVCCMLVPTHRSLTNNAKVGFCLFMCLLLPTNHQPTQSVLTNKASRSQRGEDTDVEQLSSKWWQLH